MNINSRITLLIAAVTLLHAPAHAFQQQESKFTSIFNGKDLTGWVGFGSNVSAEKLRAMTEDEREALYAKSDINEHWSVEDGVLVNDGHGMFLTTRKHYRDFEFMVEYKTVAKADSGIYLRGVPQVQIWDSTDESKFKIGADKGSGGLWNNAAGAKGKDPLVLADKAFGEWNAFRVKMIGERVTVHLNGKLVVDDAPMANYWNRKKPITSIGPIRLQTHGGEIRWRNIMIREIGSEEANASLAGGFKRVFNGKDFTGWVGPTDNYEIIDGAIRCKAGKGGNLLTAKQYSDFVVRLEFKLPPGGNNGLAIRSPGPNVNPAYQAMCELQVLDSEHPKYAKLDKRQYHGSVYGIIPAHRGHLRPTGEWNFQEVTVKGSTIKVELNGTVILDGDVSKVTDYMAKSPHPGKDRKSGHFGFAGHNDPVTFRNIWIKEL